MNIVPCFSPLITYLDTIAHDVSRRYFGYPVYLVGGALIDQDREPRDIDLIIILPDREFRWLYGTYDDWVMGRAWPNATWLMWARDCAKQSHGLSEHARRMIDFRVQHEKVAAHFPNEPKLRLSAEIIPGR